MSEDLLSLFRRTGALLDGHFVLRSGLHSRQFFQRALLLRHTEIAADVCGRLADKLRAFPCDAVISPALCGIVVGQEVGRAFGKRHIFTEKEAVGWFCAARSGWKLAHHRLECGWFCLLYEDLAISVDVMSRQRHRYSMANEGGSTRSNGVPSMGVPPS